MATEKECFEVGKDMVKGFQSKGVIVRIIRLVGGSIPDGFNDYLYEKLGDDWDNQIENQQAFVNGWNSVADK